MLVVNCGFYLVSFIVLTPTAEVRWRQLLPGSIIGAVGFTLLITVGAGLVQHQLKHSGATYGQFAAVIGLVTFLLLLAKLTLYAAELNPVLARGLWPRALPTCPPTPADDEHLQALVQEQRRRTEQQAGDPKAGDPQGSDPQGGEQQASDKKGGDQIGGVRDATAGAGMVRRR
jgi:uncharacterized BrkB/YihY/UPF0761 family membrane protein